MTILIFILIISILVFVHELGHFLAARRLGVDVEEFGFGFPPRILGLRKGRTTYSLNWIPFGGFVRLKGEVPGTSMDADSFAAQSRPRRFVILAAGVVMNYLLTFVLLTVGFSFGLPAARDAVPPGGQFSNVKPQVISLEEAGPAARAGMTIGDTILEANGTPISSAEDLKRFEQGHGEQPFTIVVRRGGASRQLTVAPTRVENEVRIGVGIIDVGLLRYPFPSSAWIGLKATINVSAQILSSFGGLLRDLVVDRKVSPDLSGPVGIVVLTGQAYALGVSYLLQFVALLSATLAVINFLPLPALDGGRALFVILEKFRGRAVDQRIESLVHAVGFYILIALVLLVSLRDVRKFGLDSRLLENVRNAFGG